MWVGQGQEAGVAHGLAIDGGDGDSGVVDEAIADHCDDLGVGFPVVGGHLGDFPGELLFPGQHGAVGVGLDDVVLHALLSRWV